MAGSPQKRARREAAKREKALAASGTVSESPSPSGLSGEVPTGDLPTKLAPTVPALQGEILPPVDAPEPTRTALKRAMRVRAQEHAEEAIGVLVANMRNDKLGAEKRESAAQKLLEWGFGKPGLELGDADGGLLVTIQKFIKDDT